MIKVTTRRDELLMSFCLRCKYGGPRRQSNNVHTTCDGSIMRGGPGCDKIPPTGFVHCDPDMTLEVIRNVDMF